MNISLIIIITILVFVPIQQLDIRKKLLIYLVLVLLALQNIEGFGTGIDGEALRNIASLYNNADGTLIVKNLKATGEITAAGGGTFGNAYIGTCPFPEDKTYAMFSHKNFKSEPNSYSALQGDTGTTFINSKGDVHIRKNNATASSTLSAGTITATGNIEATGYGTFGNAYIGKHNTTDNNWATFCHKNHKTNRNDYALAQHSAGLTVLNSPSDQLVKINRGASDTIFSTKSGIATVKNLEITACGGTPVDRHDDRVSNAPLYFSCPTKDLMHIGSKASDNHFRVNNRYIGID